MSLPTLAIVLGTAREGRASESIAQFAVNVTETSGLFIPVLVDVKDFPQTQTARLSEKTEGSTVTSWGNIARAASAFMFVVPEYNRGYPGEFKLLIDALHDEYARKPALICGVSNGKFGGMRVAEHLKPVLIDLGLVLLSKALPVPEAPTFFSGTRSSDRDAFTRSLTRSLEELHWFANRLASR